MKRYDVAIIGAGIAGAGLAAEVALHASVLILEGEDQPGYHATGRSAAFWSESYGGPAIQPLTSASGDVLRAHGFLQALGGLQIGRAEDQGLMEAFMVRFADSGIALEQVDPHDHIPGLRPEWVLGLAEPSSAYIDVGGLHAMCLGTAKRAGADLVTRARVTSAVHDGAGWTLETTAGSYRARILVNAAGAWADQAAEIAGVRPVGITAYRRTVVQLRIDPAVPDDLPHVSDFASSFYFKPEAGGKIWLSPHDETLDNAHDVAAEELDVAIAIDRLEQVVDWQVQRVERAWAGLRSFAADRLPVYGFDVANPAYFWCVGQGGFGIQTAPAASALAAAVLLGQAPPAFVAHINPVLYSPERFLG